ncbi:hypothetical protein H8847_005069 [Salmonella enterica]|nr:hypothetical protein [Salmonella enterica]EDS4043783.1 hypothetical protein [Salmonella enterica subsp. enterica serovar Saintpaul]EGC2020759.1 hypothetical protein [Salmonella enterica]EGC2022153.1 hypothetical protein [Salmonella enterica]EGX2397170.1 hypothetical protein [Salmonella enterica]
MTKPQRKRLTGGKTRERVQAAGFSLTLFQDRNGVASVTAKVNTADDGWEATPGEDCLNLLQEKMKKAGPF